MTRKVVFANTNKRETKNMHIKSLTMPEHSIHVKSKSLSCQKQAAVTSSLHYKTRLCPSFTTKYQQVLKLVPIREYLSSSI